jgi:predicted membrane channel-forming protein YqfA (hemolysin III family)
MGLFIGGGFGVLLAACVVKSLKLVALRWLVVGVVLYAAGSLLAARRAPRVS